MILHLRQIRFTEARTFMPSPTALLRRLLESPALARRRADSGRAALTESRQDQGSFLRDRDGVLVVRGTAAVGGHRGPTVVQDAHLRAAGVHHGLDADHHAPAPT